MGFLIGAGALGMINPADILTYKDAGIAALAIGACIVLYRDQKRDAAKREISCKAEADRREKLEGERHQKLEVIIGKTAEALTANTEVLRECHRFGGRRKTDPDGYDPERERHHL